MIDARGALLILALVTAGCGRNPAPPAPEHQMAGHEEHGARGSLKPAPEYHPSPAAAPTPVRPISETERSPQAAVATLQRYCDAIATRDFPRAYRLLGGRGPAAGKTERGFAAQFAGYAAYDCRIGKPGQPEGAAGSIYLKLPLTVTGARTNGRALLLSGSATLRRVNDVDGATAAQRSWQVEAVDLATRR